MLEDLFAKHAGVLKRPFEVVRTVGFEAISKSGAGETKPFRFRIEIIRFLGADDFQPIVSSADADPTQLPGMVWQVTYNPRLSRANPDAVLEAILEHLATWLRTVVAVPVLSSTEAESQNQKIPEGQR